MKVLEQKYVHTFYANNHNFKMEIVTLKNIQRTFQQQNVNY